MKKISFKKAVAAVAAMSIVACGALPFVSVPSAAADTIEVAIDRKTVSIDEAKAGVPIYVRMNEGHPGLKSVEFGFVVDTRCTFTIIDDSDDASEYGGESLSVVMTNSTGVIPGGTEEIAWLTWASAKANEKAKNWALIMVTVPDPEPGEKYAISYRTEGVNPENPNAASPHLFKDGATNYVANGVVTAVDGWVEIEGPEPTPE
ncbi:MAG: hypothetical protein K2J88_06250, partial [Oscillospiraceae bacterium]|nr:hypothetical protein [Oscillospiraceae bacterium]